MFVIAGVTGHVGGVAAQQLLAAKQRVKVIVRNSDKAKEWSARGAEVAIGELDDVKFLTTALTNATGFFTLLPPNYGAADFYGAQRATSDNIAAAVKASGVPHVVLLSSVGADMATNNGPIKGLHYLENVLRATGTKLTAIRAAYFQENAGNSLAPAKAQGIFPNFTPSADYPFPMVATADIGALAARALQNPPVRSETVDLAGPSYSTRQVAEALGKALGKDLQIVDIPPAGHVAAFMQAGMPQGISEAYAEMMAGFASGSITPKGDRAEMGTTTLDDTIKHVVAG